MACRLSCRCGQLLGDQVIRRQRKPRRLKKPTVVFQDGRQVQGLKSYTEKAGPGKFRLFWCATPICKRSDAAKALAKGRCPDCIQGKEGETLKDLVTRIVTVGAAKIPKEQVDEFLLVKMAEHMIDTAGLPTTPPSPTPIEPAKET